MAKKAITKRQRAFINLYLYEDKTQTQCAHEAGFKHPGVYATRLLHGEDYAHVQEEIQKKQAKQQEKYEIRFEKTAKKLAQIRDAALAEGSFNAALGAEVARAKLGGLMVDRKEVKYGRVDQMDRTEVERRLKQLLSENQLASLLSTKDRQAFKQLDADKVHLRAEEIESAGAAVQADLDKEFADAEVVEVSEEESAGEVSAGESADETKPGVNGGEDPTEPAEGELAEGQELDKGSDKETGTSEDKTTEDNPE